MAMSTSRPASALGALTVAERAAVFDELLAVRPELRDLAESLATRLLSSEDRFEVADAVQDDLMNMDFAELSGRAGYHPVQGYVHPVEAAREILDEQLGPFRHDLERRATLGLDTAAVELAVGILFGLHACRHAGGETLLEYAPDYALERAADVVDQCLKLGIELPVGELVDVLSGWRHILGGEATHG